MSKRLLVAFLVVAAALVLAGFASAQSIRAGRYAARNTAAAVGLVSFAGSDPASSELMNPEFGCGGGGHLEYDPYQDD